MTSQGVGDRRAPFACRPRSWTRRTSSSSRDPSPSSDVSPVEPVDLGAAEPGVEGDRVGETVLGLESGEQPRLRARARREAVASRRSGAVRPAAVGFARRAGGSAPTPTRRWPRRPRRASRCVDRERPFAASPSIHVCQSISAMISVGDPRPELRAQEVAPGPARVVDRLAEYALPRPRRRPIRPRSTPVDPLRRRCSRTSARPRLSSARWPAPFSPPRARTAPRYGSC